MYNDNSTQRKQHKIQDSTKHIVWMVLNVNWYLVDDESS